jgi:predicted transcriptional regulator
MSSPLEKLRNLFELSQKRLAKLAGVSQGHISEVEHELTKPCEKLRDFLKEVDSRIRQIID